MTTVTEDLLGRIRRRYPAPEWVVLSEVRSAAGQTATRTADAIAMNMWPSRGLAVHGFEIKASRGDWLRELKAPSKAEAVARYCDFWWLVIPEAEVLSDGELPMGWGALVKRGNGLGVLHEAKEIEDPEPISRSFAAAMLRRAQQEVSTEGQLLAEYQRGFGHGETRGRENAETTARRGGNDLEQLQAQVAAFEEQVGFPITGGWKTPAGLAEAVKTVVEGRLDSHLRQIGEVRRIAQHVLEATEPTDVA